MMENRSIKYKYIAVNDFNGESENDSPLKHAAQMYIHMGNFDDTLCSFYVQNNMGR